MYYFNGTYLHIFIVTDNLRMAKLIRTRFAGEKGTLVSAFTLEIVQFVLRTSIIIE